MKKYKYSIRFFIKRSLAAVNLHYWHTYINCTAVEYWNWCWAVEWGHLSAVGFRLIIVGCRCRCRSLFLQADCRLSAVGCRLLIVGCRCRSLFLVSDCRMSTVGCQLLIVGCCCRSMLLVAGCRVSVVGCRVFIVGVGCRSKFWLSVPSYTNCTCPLTSHKS